MSNSSVKSINIFSEIKLNCIEEKSLAYRKEVVFTPVKTYVMTIKPLILIFVNCNKNNL